jgi:hypothetical protein
MIQIREEAEEVLTGQQPQNNNVLKNAPHPIDVLTVSEQEWNKCVCLFIQSILALRRLADRIPAKRQHIP